ncbi:MAG: hypothetical protein FWC13_09430 [Oscillospiraceae bacterium]|nr:hypothetical protein [Oscillospiraceae bacterium]
MKLSKNTLKRVVTIILITVFVFAFTASAFAATQSDLIAFIQNLRALRPGPNSQNALAQAYVWLRQTTITDAEATTIMSQLNSAVASAGDANAFIDLSAAQLQEILLQANAASETLNLTLAADLDAGTFILRDAAGNIIVSATAYTGIIQQTGIDHSGVIIITIAIVALFGVAAITSVAIRKKKQAISAIPIHERFIP